MSDEIPIIVQLFRLNWIMYMIPVDLLVYFLMNNTLNSNILERNTIVTMFSHESLLPFIIWTFYYTPAVYISIRVIYTPFYHLSKNDRLSLDWLWWEESNMEWWNTIFMEKLWSWWTKQGIWVLYCPGSTYRLEMGWYYVLSALQESLSNQGFTK